MLDIHENLLVKVHNILEQNRSKISSKDYYFFNVYKLEEAAKFMVKFQNHCQVCKANEQEIIDLSREFPKLLTTISGRREFTNRLDKVLKHLQKEHKIFPKGYFTGLYTVLGILFGFVLAYIITKIKFLSFYTSLMIFSGLGFIIGWIAGQLKDTKIAKNNHQIK